MALTDITEKIIADAKNEASQILSSANSYASDVSYQTQQDKKEIAEDATVKIEKTTFNLKNRLESSAKHEASLLIESKKRELIDDVFTETQNRIDKMHAGEYKALLKNSFQLLPVLPEVTCLVPEGREKETVEVLSELNLKFDIKTTKDFNGGFVISTDDMEFGMRFDSLALGKKKELEAEVARTLFM